jgi:hypothetical protein
LRFVLAGTLNAFDGAGDHPIQFDTGEIVKTKNVLRDEHGPGHVTPAGRSVFYDLFPKLLDELAMVFVEAAVRRLLKEQALRDAVQTSEII